jgi:hypothetical protein
MILNHTQHVLVFTHKGRQRPVQKAVRNGRGTEPLRSPVVARDQFVESRHGTAKPERTQKGAPPHPDPAETTQGPPPFWVEPGSPSAAILRPLHELNERCIELLVQSARTERPDAFPIVIQLRGILQGLSPEIQTRAARKAFLLVDLEFTNAAWWQMLRSHPARPAPLPSWRGSFPRRAAVPLARATLMFAWHSLRADRNAACLLGMNSAVSEVIAALSLTDIDRIVDRRFRHLRPRWEDRPAVWRQLLQAAQSTDIRRTRDVNLRGLQLLVGEML